MFLIDIAQQLRRKNADVYFTLLDAAGKSPTLILHQNAKAKERGRWVLAKSERQKLQRLITQGCASYGSVRNLMKASNLSVSKVRQFLLSKPFYTKFVPATGKFKPMKAFARFRIENWCMDLAYVDKLAKDNNGVKYLLVRQDPFNRTVDANGMKTKDSKKTVSALLTMISKKNRPKRFGFDKGICWPV